MGEEDRWGWNRITHRIGTLRQIWPRLLPPAPPPQASSLSTTPLIFVLLQSPPGGAVHPATVKVQDWSPYKENKEEWS